MFDPSTVVEKAKTSSFYLKILNWSLNRMIPFNKPHSFRVIEIGDNHIKTKIPYQKKNFNHIRGLHACALATISEFTTGFLLVTKLDAKKYRLIMQRLEMDYHYQGKTDAYAEFTLTPEWFQDNIYYPLTSRPSTVVICEVKIYDVKGNQLTTGKVHWQIKSWDKVKTAL
jgi:acyl-coenzyme A thioesterase PaaI-like protein